MVGHALILVVSVSFQLASIQIQHQYAHGNMVHSVLAVNCYKKAAMIKLVVFSQKLTLKNELFNSKNVIQRNIIERCAGPCEDCAKLKSQTLEPNVLAVPNESATLTCLYNHPETPITMINGKICIVFLSLTFCQLKIDQK